MIKAEKEAIIKGIEQNDVEQADVVIRKVIMWTILIKVLCYNFS